MPLRRGFAEYGGNEFHLQSEIADELLYKPLEHYTSLNAEFNVLFKYIWAFSINVHPERHWFNPITLDILSTKS